MVTGMEIVGPAAVREVARKTGSGKKFFSRALERSLARPYSGGGSRYQAVADWVVDLATGVYEDAGYKLQLEAIRFIAERTEGRPMTQVEHSGSTQHTRIVLKWQDSHIIPDVSDDPLLPIAYETLDAGYVDAEVEEIDSGITD
jgi:hypothetical protein